MNNREKVENANLFQKGRVLLGAMTERLPDVLFGY